MPIPDLARIDDRLAMARRLESGRQILQAELLYLGIFDEMPGHPVASTRLAALATARGDIARSIQLFQTAVAANPDHPQLAVDLAIAYVAADQQANAIAALESAVVRTPDHAPAWLLLGRLRDAVGDSKGGLRALFEAVTRARQAGQWRDQSTTPPQLLEAVIEAIERVRLGRRDLFLDAYDCVRGRYGAAALARVDRAVTGYLREWNATPPDPRQRPQFLYFPDLPGVPYHDPALQSWAPALRAAYPVIREEALRLISEDQRLPDFVQVKAGDRMENYVTGDGPNPSWQAFFFYRRGMRYDSNHARCPQTSAILESIELCRISQQAPEICFSVLRPGSTIRPHHGVTNTRLVMHLPLVVPADCALNLIGAGQHKWQEGDLVMFDDTFEHEAWNRSNQTRIVLLMDCWNPHLTEPEKVAVKLLVETISALQLDARPHAASGALGD